MLTIYIYITLFLSVLPLPPYNHSSDAALKVNPAVTLTILPTSLIFSYNALVLFECNHIVPSRNCTLFSLHVWIISSISLSELTPGSGFSNIICFLAFAHFKAHSVL